MNPASVITPTSRVKRTGGGGPWGKGAQGHQSGILRCLMERDVRVKIVPKAKVRLQRDGPAPLGAVHGFLADQPHGSALPLPPSSILTPA